MAAISAVQRKFGEKSVGNGSKYSVARVFAPGFRHLVLCSRGEAILFWVTSGPFLVGRVKAEGENLHIGVFYLRFYGCLLVM